MDARKQRCWSIDTCRISIGRCVFVQPLRASAHTSMPGTGQTSIKGSESPSSVKWGCFAAGQPGYETMGDRFITAVQLARSMNQYWAGREADG